MKKIINGKNYDTDTAKLIGRYRSDCGQSDFRYYGEELYLKQTGEYFLFGEGHGMSKYAYHAGNCSGWGEKIIPMTRQEAFQWASEESDLTVEEVEEHFGEIAE